jgi:hypothetical protein
MSKLKIESELCFNIWFFVSLKTKLSFEWRAKTYNLAGPDSFKSNVLKQLSGTDMVNAPAYPTRKNLTLTDGDKKFEGFLPLGMLQDDFDFAAGYYFGEIEKSLNQNSLMGYPNLSSNETIQKLGDSAYYVMTIVFQNEEGEFMPYITEENQIWCNEQAKRYGWRDAKSYPFY